MNNTFQNTNYYDDIMQAYNAGKNNNTQLRDNLINNLGNSLSNSCKKYIKNPNIITQVDSPAGTISNIDLDSYIGKYTNNIEFTNSLKEQLLADEETYFINKYGANVYNYLLSLRNQYLLSLDAQTIQRKCSRATSNIQSSTSSTTSTTTSGINGINNTSSETTLLCNDNGLKYYDLFSKYIPYIDPNVTNRKIDYRETEHDFLMKLNSIINFIYYVLFFIMIILLIGGKNLQFNQRFPIYFLLLILPFLYPYFFKILYHTYIYLTDIRSIHGPKNAFLDTEGERNIIDAYNN